MGAQEGSATLYIGGHHATSSLIKGWDGGETRPNITVPVTTLEKLIERHGVPRYIKIDVEGFEAEVAAGLQRKVDLVSMEYHLTSTDLAAKQKAVDHLAKFGRLTINILPETSDFALSKFEPAPIAMNLLAQMVGEAEPKKIFGYGDLFVRSE